MPTTPGLLSKYREAGFPNLVRAKLNKMFVGIHHKHFGYKRSEASPFYSTVLTVSGHCVPQYLTLVSKKDR